MNETSRIEQAYYQALGLVAEYKAYEEYDCLVDNRGNEHPGILFSSQRGFDIMFREEINVEFMGDCVQAWHPDGTSGASVLYGSEKWKSKLWVLNAAIVMAATDKLNYAKLLWNRA